MSVANRKRRQAHNANLDTLASNGFATQANMEAEAASKTVTADVVKYSPGTAKCWACVTVSAGTPTLATSYNITSITDSGVGDLTVTIATDFSSADWVPQITVTRGNLLSGPAEGHTAVLAIGADSVEFGHTNAAPAATDPAAWFFVGYGDQ